MIRRDDILRVLRTIDDPEMPISIVDLGLVDRVEVEEHARVEIDLLPTFVGCHALPMMEREIREKVGALPGVAAVNVRFRYEPPWSVDRISEAGRAALAGFGVTVPQHSHSSTSLPEHVVALGTPRPTACPFCRSRNVRLESPFGPTRCRMIYYCEDCHNPFEHLKRV